MIYVKNNKRYSNNQLARMGVKDPFANGFSRLIDVRPMFDSATQKLQDIGTEKGAIVYEIVALTDDEIEAERKAKIPQVITKLQAMKQMQQMDKWTQFKAILADPANEDLSDEWLLSNELNRTYPLVAQMGLALEVDEVGLDTFFIEASKIE